MRPSITTGLPWTNSMLQPDTCEEGVLCMSTPFLEAKAYSLDIIGFKFG